MKHVFKRMWLLGIAAASVIWTGCDDDEVPVSPMPDPGTDAPSVNEYIPKGTIDLANGELIRLIDEDSLAEHKLPLSILKEVEIESEGSDYFKLTCEQENGQWYVVPTQIKPLDKPYEVVPVKIAPKEFPEAGRHVLLVFRQCKPQTKADGNGLTSVYSEVIGKGTRCYLGVGNTTQSVFDYDKIEALGDQRDEYLTVNSTLNNSLMLEFEGSSYTETMEQWSFNVGASFDKSLKAGNRTIGKRTFGRPDRSWSGTFSFGMEGEMRQSESYEYYFNLYLVNRADIAMNMALYEQDAPDEALISLMNAKFMEALKTEPTKFNASTFYDTWGTDVITQGTFGGYHLYLYGRKENIYETQIGFDASASLRRSTPDTSNLQPGQQWLNIFIMKNSDYVQADAKISYNNEEYEQASKSFSITKTVGGNTASDPTQWEEGFNSSMDNWTLVNYKVKSTDPETTNCLYPIEQIVEELILIVENRFDNLTAADSTALQRLVDNYNTLAEGKAAYLDSKGVVSEARARLVVADMIVKSGDNGHQKGQPESFIAKDPNDQNNYLIYYPIMANPYAPTNVGYAFETSQDDYIVGVDTDDKYWYYAMASSKDTRGIVDAVFATEDEMDDITNGRYYMKRGIQAQSHSGVAPKHNYMYLKYYDSGIDEESDKITAVGFVDKKNSNKVIASTGGSELRPNATQTEELDFNNFWRSEYVRWYDRDWTGWCYNEGSVTVHHPFYMIYSVADLPIKHFTAESVWQPKKWGE